MYGHRMRPCINSVRGPTPPLAQSPRRQLARSVTPTPTPPSPTSASRASPSRGAPPPGGGNPNLFDNIPARTQWPEAAEQFAVRVVFDAVHRIAPDAQLRTSRGITRINTLSIIYILFDLLRQHVHALNSGVTRTHVHTHRHATHCAVTCVRHPPFGGAAVVDTGSTAATDTCSTKSGHSVRDHDDDDIPTVESIRRATAAEWPVWIEFQSATIGYAIFGSRALE